MTDSHKLVLEAFHSLGCEFLLHEQVEVVSYGNFLEVALVHAILLIRIQDLAVYVLHALVEADG